MKKFLAAAVIAGLAGLTACSVSTPAPESTTSTQAPAASAQASPSRSSSGQSSTASAAPQAGDAKEACELFNSLFAEYRASPPTSNAYEDIYTKAAKARTSYTGNLRALFSSLAAMAIGHSAVVEKGGEPDQASKDAVRDAVFANAGTCTAEGVTLTL